jgi:CubicO group peptidase (beta-lactamase class C family)
MTNYRLRLALLGPFFLLASDACGGTGFSAVSSDAGGAPASPPPGTAPAPQASSPALDPNGGIAYAYPDEQGVDAAPLIGLTQFVRDANPPVFSLVVSKNGTVVYELYTSSLTRDHAHYLMSVTKSVTSTLVGIATDQKLVGGPDTSVADALPPGVFGDETNRARFRTVTIRDVLGMSALDAQVPPHRNLPADQARQAAFLAAPNRAAFALTQAILPSPGVSFQYTDITPLIATGILEYAARETELDFAEQTLFGPMDFRNYEWMHEDTVGMDNGAYGLRLRPVDMQKIGLLFLRRGLWEGKTLVSAAWVDRCFAPWIASSPASAAPNYGWYWWTFDYAPHWRALVADGWRGQRISIVPERNVVVTMTGDIEDGTEEDLYQEILRDYVIPAIDGVNGQPPHPDPSLRQPLADVMEQVRQGALRVKPGVELRMIPSIASKGTHHPLNVDF